MDPQHPKDAGILVCAREPRLEMNPSITHEVAFEMASSNVRFGAGVTREVGMDLADLGVRNALVITDSTIRGMRPFQTVLESLDAEGIGCTIYDRVRVEPNDESFLDAIAFAGKCDYGAIVAVGGGSTIDTAKAVNLYTCYPPADFLDYVNPPIGRGLPVPGPLKPLIAIPTTAGTGSETTGVAIFDLSKMRAKTGIASRRLKPTLGLLDPENTRTMPAQVAAATGLDVLSHAVESYTALPYSDRPLPDRPLLRPAYQGSNPISDVWSLHAMRMVARYLVRAVEDPSDDEARANMIRRQRLERPSRRCGKGARRPDHLVHRAAQIAQWIACAGLHLSRYPRTGRGNPAAAPRHQALAAPSRSRGSCPPVRRSARGILIVAAEDCKGASLAPSISALIDSSQSLSHSLRQSRPSYRKSLFHFPKNCPSLPLSWSNPPKTVVL